MTRDEGIVGVVERYLASLPDEREGGCPECACTYRLMATTVCATIDLGYGRMESEPIGTVAVCNDCAAEYQIVVKP